MYRARTNGADVRGYFYWSLLDNFEWMLGFGQKFGLVAAEGPNRARRVKESAKVLARHAANRP